MASVQNPRYYPMQEMEVLSLKPQGLYTYPNPLSAVPQGALSVAINVILSRPFVTEQRRGVAPYGIALSNDINHLYNYQNRIIINHGNKLAYDSDNAGTWVDYNGTYSPPSGSVTIHSTQANKNIYFNTSTGIQKLDLINGTIKAAGVSPGLDGAGSTTGSGWFTNNTQVAYRIVFGYTDANNNLILGAPSQRIVVANSSGGATNVSLTFTLPAGLTTSYIYQVYRSPMSADLNTEPNDECALVFTGNPSSTDLTNGFVTITDSVNDSLKGAFIYTASSQQGLTQSNYQPPIAVDLTTFKGFTMYLNTTGQQQIFLTLVAVSTGGSSGIRNGDTVTIGGVTYTGASSEVIASAQFQIFTAGTPSQNITNTANSLVRVINRYSGNTTVYAYYSSGYSDLPGRILLSERGIGGSTFTAACSRTGCFVPEIGTTTATSTNSTNPNYVFISKFQQPEAVPLAQFLPVGSADKAGLRIIALRDYVLVIKQDGIFEIVGQDINSFQVLPLDLTTILVATESAVALNNKGYQFSQQGIVSVTYNEGALLKCQPIKQDLLTLASPQFVNFNSASYGIAYESENQYLFGTVTNTSDSVATQHFVYNYLTDTWTTYEYPFHFKCGFVNPTDNKLYFGSGDSASRFVYQERKNYDNTDYADNSFAVNITGFVGTTVSMTSTASVVAGQALAQGLLVANVISVVDSTHITIDNVQSWVNGAATVYNPINSTLQFVPEGCGNPGIVHHFKEIHGVFSTADFSQFTVGVVTDFQSDPANVLYVPKFTDGFGLGSFGPSPFGGGNPPMQIIRQYVPLNQRRGHWLNLQVNYNVALTKFALDGFVIYHQTASQRFH